MRASAAFVMVAFVWAWGFGLAAARVKAERPSLGAALQMVAGFGPSIAGVAVVAVSSGREGLRQWFARCLRWKVGWRWFVAAFLTPPLLMMFALVVHVALGGELPAFPAAQHVPMAIANFGLVFLVGGPLGEEFGWRGYLTPALTARFDWRVASLLVGVVWGLWHLPLFLVGGSVQSEMPVFFFLLNILAGSVLFGWFFEHHQGSIVPTLVLHMSLNAWAGILSIVPTATMKRPYFLATGILVALAVALLLIPDSWKKTHRAALDGAT